MQSEEAEQQEEEDDVIDSRREAADARRAASASASAANLAELGRKKVTGLSLIPLHCPQVGCKLMVAFFRVVHYGRKQQRCSGCFFKTYKSMKGFYTRNLCHPHWLLRMSPAS